MIFFLFVLRTSNLRLVDNNTNNTIGDKPTGLKIFISTINFCASMENCPDNIIQNVKTDCPYLAVSTCCTGRECNAIIRALGHLNTSHAMIIVEFVDHNTRYCVCIHSNGSGWDGRANTVRLCSAMCAVCECVFVRVCT